MLTKEMIDRLYGDIEKMGLKFPVARISEATGYSKGNVSEFLSKKEPISEGFYNAFYKAFPGSHKVPAEVGIGELSEGIKNLSEATLVLARNNEKLVNKITDDDPEQTPTAVESRLTDLLELIAKVGSGKRWKSEQEAHAALSRLFYGDQKKREERGIRDDLGK